MREGEGWVAENIERMRKKRGSVYVFRRKEKEAKERGITIDNNNNTKIIS